VTVPEQPTLTDGVVTLRRWTLEDVEEAVAGHDEVIAHWFGWPVDGVTPERMSQAIERWHTAYAEGRSEVAFAVEAEGKLVGSVDLRRRDDGVGELSWLLFQGQRGRGFATRAVRMLADFALSEDGQGGLGYWRVEAKVEPDNQASLRVMDKLGMRYTGMEEWDGVVVPVHELTRAGWLAARS
jgi:RimJ/RimL family protein N-acetyltransferase